MRLCGGKECQGLSTPDNAPLAEPRFLASQTSTGPEGQAPWNNNYNVTCFACDSYRERFI